MKVEEVNRYSPENPCSVFVFEPKVISFGDVLYGGCENGALFYCLVASGSICEYSQGFPGHRGQVSSIFASFHRKIVHRPLSAPLGTVFSGGRDHTIKVWNPFSTDNPLIQTLIGHNGIVTSITDTHDGLILSCSSEGTLKVWAPVDERGEFLNPFFQCVFTFKSQYVWYTSICIGIIGTWTSYVSDSDGNIDVFRKAQSSSLNTQLVKHSTWQKVHSLSITSMIFINDEDLLCTTSSDGFCKLIDSKSGLCVRSIHNNRQARYESIAWVGNENRLYITDELGYIEIFSIQKMTVVSTLHLYKQSVSEKACTLASHKFPILGKICKAKDNYHFFLLLPAATSLQSKSGAYSGEIAKWRLHVNQSVLYFEAHKDEVIAIAAISDVKTFHDIQSNDKRVAYMSREESCLVTVSLDNSIRCWDEFDSKERHQIKLRHSGHLLSSLVLWYINCIVVSYDDGHVFVWNIDSAESVGKSFNSPIQAMCEARNNHSYGILVAGLSGKISFMDLSMYQINPTCVPIDYTQQGFHDCECPAILSVAYHDSTNTIFTGGDDRTIRYWKSSSRKAMCINTHDDAVCCLQLSSNFLLSGDESGNLIFWELSGSETIDIKAVELCRWNSLDLGSKRAMGQLVQIDRYSGFILKACLIGKITVWHFELKNAEINYSNDGESILGSPVVSIEKDSELKLNPKSEKVIVISKYAEIVLEGNEASSVYMTMSRDYKTNIVAPDFVYCGTVEGPALRFDIQSYRSSV